MSSRQLTTGGKIAAATGAAFLVDSLIPWHRECFDLVITKTCASENAWGTPFSLLATLLVALLVAEVVAVQLLDQKLPSVGTLSWAQVRLIASGAALGLVLLQFLVGDSPLGRSFGLFIGILLAAGLLYGTLTRNKESEALTP